MRFADVVLCACGLLIAEAVVVASLWRRELAGGFELVRAVALLVPLGIAAAVPLLVVATVLAGGLERPRSARARWTWTVFIGLLAFAVAVGVSGGRLLAGWRRPGFVALATGLAAAAAWWGAPRSLPLAHDFSREHRWGFLGAISVLVVLVELVNASVLHRLYPAFHAGLAVATLWLAATASTAWPSRGGGRPRLRAIGAVVALALGAVALLVAPGQLRTADNLRFFFLERAPLLSYSVRLAAQLATPLPLGDAPPDAVAHRGPRAVDLSGRDLVIVSIDALRADHVGAYGYHRGTTPALDELAAGGVLFEAAYTATPHTSYAVTSLMTGKYMRPLLLQGVGEESETLARVLRRYGYRTAAFFPPATFFVDRQRFATFERRNLDFEYVKRQFADSRQVAAEVREYLAHMPHDRRVLLWAHLFEPHEPYLAHAAYVFGDRDVDRYDSEVAFADAALADIVASVRAKRPGAVVIVTADHGEEFGDHGGRYHGTTVYDEQVRVPLVVSAPGVLGATRVQQPVSLVDVMPTVLSALGIPVSPRVRGHDLGPWLRGSGRGQGFAFAETDEQTLLAVSDLRLVCARRVGACRLFDVQHDAAQRQDASSLHPEKFAALERQLAQHVASLGRYEQGTGGRAWPRALRRGIAGDVEAALDVAGLLQDADVVVRRKAAEVLFELGAATTAPQLRHTLRRDEDESVRRWCALALTRMGQGAPLVFDLLKVREDQWRRLAALALAEADDDRGEDVLIGWWRAAFDEHGHRDRAVLGFERARQVAEALARLKSKRAVGPLGWALGDVRLRVSVARALAEIGERAARPMLGKALLQERYQDARLAIAEALVSLGGDVELRAPLVRFLGVPDPLPQGLALALEAGVLRYVGGPRRRDLERLRAYSTSGVRVDLVVPEGGNGRGLRVIVRAENTGTEQGQIRFGLAGSRGGGEAGARRPVPKRAPRLLPALSVTLRLTPGETMAEHYATLPAVVAERAAPGAQASFVVYATQGVNVRACVVVPLDDELPPPAPVVWRSGSGDGDGR